jgi:hypothetical protein
VFVHLSQIDQFLHKVILRHCLAGGEAGVRKGDLERRLNPSDDQEKANLRTECSGWLLMSNCKRGNRLNRVLQHMVAHGHVKLARGWDGQDWVVPLNVLDKIVAALNESDDSDKRTASGA